jgi:phosphatidylglycerophosphatase A
MIKRLMMSGLGLGYAPVASGTFGSAGAICIGLLAWAICPVGGGAYLNVAWVVLALLAGAGCAAWGPWAVEYYSARARKLGDPGHVVLDEFAGQWVSLIGLPLALARSQFTAALAVFAVQFLLFRVFDVLKLPPARRLERLPAGWGILMDDIAAGVQANLVGQLIFRLWLHW